MSFATDVDSMNRIPSHVSTAVENTAASSSAPSHAGSSWMNSAGSTLLASAMPGSAARALMPSNTGRNANAMSTSALSAMPTVSARSLAAPYDFWISPGEMTNAGPVSARIVQPDPGPDE